MDITIANQLYGARNAPLPQNRAQRTPVPASDSTPAPSAPSNDVPSFSRDDKTGTRITFEKQEDLPGGGYRRTRTYEREDGRNFTKVEDFALTERGARRTVAQQNPSGSITLYEEILDREPGGNFRRTQRFRDEAGETATQITGNYRVSDPFILTGGDAAPSYTPLSPFGPQRGTRLDLNV